MTAIRVAHELKGKVGSIHALKALAPSEERESLIDSQQETVEQSRTAMCPSEALSEECLAVRPTSPAPSGSSTSS